MISKKLAKENLPDIHKMQYIASYKKVTTKEKLGIEEPKNRIIFGKTPANTFMTVFQVRNLSEMSHAILKSVVYEGESLSGDNISLFPRVVGPREFATVAIEVPYDKSKVGKDIQLDIEWKWFTKLDDQPIIYKHKDGKTEKFK